MKTVFAFVVTSFALFTYIADEATADPSLSDQKPEEANWEPKAGLRHSNGVPPERSEAFLNYVKEIQATIRGNWKYRGSDDSLVCRVTFSLSQQGDISDLKVRQSSGDLAFDQSVLEAVDNSNPLFAPPSDLYDSFKRVNLAFSAREKNT